MNKVHGVQAIKNENLSIKPFLLGFAVQLFFFIGHLWVSVWTQYSALAVSSYFHLYALLFWILSILHIHLKIKAEKELQELQEAEKKRGSNRLDGQLFLAEDFGYNSFRYNLKRYEKYILPVITVFGSLLYIHFSFTSHGRYHSEDLFSAPVNLFKACAFFASLSFLGMVFGLYLKNISVGSYRSGRGAALFLLVSVFFTVIQILLLLGYSSKIFADLKYLDLFATTIAGLVGFELILGSLLGFVRPVAPGAEVIPPYESRLATLIISAGSFAETFNKMIDYQFGFKVSETWLYLFLKKTLIPFLVFQLVCGLLATSFVMVANDEVGVLERWGKPVSKENKGILSSGFHLKLPWPIEDVEKINHKKIMSLELGHKNHGHEAMGESDLATNEHYKETELFIVRRKSSFNQEIYLELLSVSSVVFFSANESEIHQYLYEYHQANKLLEECVQSALTSFLSTKVLEKSLPVESLGWNEEFQELLKAVVKRDLPGLNIHQVLLNNIHYPAELNESIIEVHKAEEAAQAKILKAKSNSIFEDVLTEKEVAKIKLASELETYQAVQMVVNEKKVIENLRVLYAKYGKVFLAREKLSLWEKIYSGVDIDFVDKSATLYVDDSNQMDDPFKALEE